ncbi:MAG: class I SAM-dependent methyltransferase [Methylophilus sp.]|nr:class I SAM-dependent methyltransferase [Methylophilus sp.]
MSKKISILMTFFKSLKLEALAWSFRRIHCPVDKKALVLEVGSGGNPYARSNVLLDAYEHTRERHWAPLISDRPTVLGFVENLPFKDKAFDFVIASHVLEHSADPEKFLSELQRVAKAGYIETPDAFMERVNPYKDHRLEVTVRDEKLVIRKKSAWQHDAELIELYEHHAKKWVTSETIPKHPFDFHVRYYWQDTINFEVLNPEVDASWKAIDDVSTIKQRVYQHPIKQVVRNVLRNLLSQKKRNKNIDLFNLLRCPNCHSEKLTKHGVYISCTSCAQEYNIVNDVPNLGF